MKVSTYQNNALRAVRRNIGLLVLLIMLEAKLMSEPDKAT